MHIEQLRNNLTDHAKDIKLNLASILTEEGAPGLKQNQIYAIALACAYASKNNVLTEAVLADSQSYLSDGERNAAKSAAIIMAMNNIYYRFVHLVSDKSYAAMPAKLRMNVIGNPGIDKIDYELYCLAVSALNGCGMCMDAHTNVLVKAGTQPQTIQSTVRIASVINAAALAISIS